MGSCGKRFTWGCARTSRQSRCGEKLHGLSRRKRTRLDQRKTVRSRRIADVADRGLGRLNWAESTRTRVASGRTGVWAKAVVPLRAQNSPHCSKRAFTGATSDRQPQLGRFAKRSTEKPSRRARLPHRAAVRSRSDRARSPVIPYLPPSQPVHRSQKTVTFSSQVSGGGP
jgi:hypothetical protein